MKATIYKNIALEQAIERHEKIYKGTSSILSIVNAHGMEDSISDSVLVMLGYDYKDEFIDSIDLINNEYKLSTSPNSRVGMFKYHYKVKLPLD